MRAIILAAGEGRRLRPLTDDRPKCMVELAGKPLLAHQLESLRRASVGPITIVTGYRPESIAALGYDMRHNPEFASTNMVATLMCAADLLDGGDDVLVAYSDIVYEPRVVSAIARCDAPLSTSVDRSWLELWRERLDDPLSDAETLKLDADGNILELGRRARSYDQIEGQYMGLIRASASFAPKLVEIYRRLDRGVDYDGQTFEKMYMTSFLQRLIDLGHPLRAVVVHGGWLEVDSTSDLLLYKRLAETNRLAAFWRPDGPTAGGR